MKRLSLLIMITIGLLIFRGVPSEALSLSLDNGGKNFGTGDSLNISIGVTNNNPVAADGYLVLILPNGTPIFFYFTSGTLNAAVGTTDAATWKKLFQNLTIPGDLNTGPVPILKYTFTGVEPIGVYQTVFAITDVNTLNVLAYKQEAFYVGYYPIAGIPGNYNGTWVNNTYSTSGAASFKVSDTAAGIFDIKITLSGNVFGGIAPPPFSITGTMNSQGQMTLSGGSSAFGTVTGSIGSDGHINAVIDSIPGGYVKSLNLSGTFASTLINLNYTVKFYSGPDAVGVITATR